MTLRVLHLVGSAVSDFYRDLSLLYARDCLQAIADPSRYDVSIAYVTPDHQWRFPRDLSPDALSAAGPVELGDAVQILTSLNVDVMVPQMFCVPGMTSYRALFDVLGIPYLGNTPDVMALAGNKAKAKAIVAASGVEVPAGERLRLGSPLMLEPPVVIKPGDSDNSLGISLVRDRADYQSALRSALAHADEALAETYVELGREVRCGIVVRNGDLLCLPLEEYDVDSERKPIRNYDDKLAESTCGELNLVAKDNTRSWIVDPGDPLTATVWDVARRCHVALGCRHYSLFDFRIDPDGNPWFLEAGLYCSFARKSVIPTMARAAGISAGALFEIALSSLGVRDG